MGQRTYTCVDQCKAKSILSTNGVDQVGLAEEGRGSRLAGTCRMFQMVATTSFGQRWARERR